MPPWVMRRWPLGVAAVALAGGLAIGRSVAPGLPATRVLPWVAVALAPVYLLACWHVWRHPGASPAVVLAFGVFLRLLVMADGPVLSSDVYRYAWDGRVQRAGLDPYRWPPAAAALAPLRDARIHPRINRPWAVTVYPPGAQVVFRVLPDDVDAIRLLMVAADLVAMVLLVGLLRQRGLDPARVVLYAWCPLVVYEVGNGGHVEAVLQPLLVGAALLAARRRWVSAGALVGWAAATKLYPALALAAIGRGPTRLTAAAAALLVAGGLYAVYAVDAGTGVVGFLPQYVRVAEDHNIGIRRLIEAALGRAVPHRWTRPVAFAACVVALLVVVGVVARQRRTVEDRMRRIAGAHVLLVPTALHPWYALWLVPWLCLAPRVAWVWLIVALPMSYLKYGAPGGVMPAWVPLVEFVPAWGALLVAVVAGRVRSR